MENRLIKLVILILLIANGSLQAMDFYQKYLTEQRDKQLIDAAKMGNKLQVSRLIGNGADVNARDINGKSALVVAANFGKLEICELLIDNYADINAKDNDGRTALFLVAPYGRLNTKMICELLVANGADVNVKDKDGFTALAMVGIYGYQEISKLLIDAMLGQSLQEQKYAAKAFYNALITKGVGKDLAKMITQAFRAQQKQKYMENKQIVLEEIMKIDDERIEQELLNYLNNT